MRSSIVLFNDAPTTAIYTLSLHDALPIFFGRRIFASTSLVSLIVGVLLIGLSSYVPLYARSEEHTSELQSRRDLVCRLLLEKKNSFVTGVRIILDGSTLRTESCSVPLGCE